jgi:chromosome segregation ATPase
VNKSELQALVREADVAVSALEIIAEKLQSLKDEIQSKRDASREKLESLTDKRDAAQVKLDALSESAADGPRGDKLREKIEELQDKIDSEIEPGYTVESIVDSLEEDLDRLSFLDDFDPASARSLADGISNYADEADDTLLELEEPNEED